MYIDWLIAGIWLWSPDSHREGEHPGGKNTITKSAGGSQGCQHPNTWSASRVQGARATAYLYSTVLTRIHEADVCKCSCCLNRVFLCDFWMSVHVLCMGVQIVVWCGLDVQIVIWCDLVWSGVVCLSAFLSNATVTPMTHMIAYLGPWGWFWCSSLFLLAVHRSRVRGQASASGKV